MGPEEHADIASWYLTGWKFRMRTDYGSWGWAKGNVIRLGPARLTHCMRWLGLAKRCMEIAAEYTAHRQGFGVKLAERMKIMMGSLAHEIQIGRLLVMHAAWCLDQGSLRVKKFLRKNPCCQYLHKVADTAIQLNGARGYSKDTPLNGFMLCPAGASG